MHGNNNGAGLLRRLFDALEILWLFVVLRPWDLGTVLRRWALAYLETRMPSAYRGPAE
jgi:hypothetical protein